MIVFFLFFKQKTAYEMRISDWSSDVCSSDLTYFNAALARGIPDGLEKGEIYLDRARALVAMDKLAEARPDIDKALSEVPKDPLAWLLSATLARRMDNLPVAQEHIADRKSTRLNSSH